MGCEQDDITPHGEREEGFTIMSGGKQVLGPEDIEFYDFSAHLIYLKEHKSFSRDYEELGDFTVLANGEEIYSGQTLPGYSSHLPAGEVVIRTLPSFYGDYILPLSFLGLRDAEGHIADDPRNDDRIIAALEQHNQFFAGLSCELRSVSSERSGQIQVNLVLTNLDDRNYYYLDPDKMGIELFHYFTNGLYIGPMEDPYAYTHQLAPDPPEPAFEWKAEWLSLLRGYESKEITLVYPDFEALPPGQYQASFMYPGLGMGVESNELVQVDGRIWLGNLSMVKSDVLIR